MNGFFRSAILATSLLVLAACDSSEERAEKHFQSGMALLEDGDVSRAIFEFRNTLALNDSHREARLTYARAARDIGNVPESYAQYLRLAEENPNDIESRLALSQMAILSQNWDEAERHGTALIQAQAEIPVEGAEIVDLALKFRRTLLDQDQPALRELILEAEELAKTYPDDQILGRLLVEGYAKDNRFDEAIAISSRLLDQNPDDPLFYQVVAELLVANRDLEGLEAHFRRTIQQFPDDEETKGNLIRLLISEGRSDNAEAFLREEIAAADDKPAAHVSLIALIRQLRGPEAALAEIENALVAYDQPPLMVALKAGILFDDGQRDGAIQLMQSITEGIEASQEIDRYRVTLAKMLVADGNEVGARQLVEQVLEHDATQVDALKMRATWQIESDEVDAAIVTLRTALDQEPEDAETMTILARAHDRNGERQLSQDLLALAVEASRNAPAESLRFARLQIQQERYSSAEEVLINSLRRSPGNLELLVTLGQVYLATSDWGRTEQVIASLRRQETQQATLAAEDLQLKMISSREGRQQGIGYLEQLVREGSDSTAATVALIRARLEEGRRDDALALATNLVESAPEDRASRLVLGNTQLALTNFDDAADTFRGLIEENPGDSLASLQLMRALGALGQLDEADRVVEVALKASPDNPDLLWAKASILERKNQIDPAIEIYERLYEINSDSPVIANNLASLLVTYRDDDVSLDRAFTVGRRLRDTEFPPFQDTYGWILFRQGDAQGALQYLEPAAEALSADPIVQYHLGKAYLAVGRNDDALEQFRKTDAAAPEDDPRTQIAEARAEIERLTTASE